MCSQSRAFGSGVVLIWLWVFFACVTVSEAHAAPPTPAPPPQAERANAAADFTETCEQALPKAEVDALVEAMREVDRASPCALERVDTQLHRTDIAWTREGMDGEFGARLGPKACVLGPTHRGTDLAYAADPELGERCPAVVDRLRAFVGEPVEHLAVVVEAQAVEYSSAVDEDPGEAPWTVAALAWLAALGLGLAVAVDQRRRSQSADADARAQARAWRFALGLGFVFALAVRLALPATLANWYGAFLPAQGWGDQRFGASSAVLQAAVRAVLPWTPSVAFGLVRVAGSLAVVLIMVLVRRLGGGLRAAGVAGVLLALSPAAARLSASSSEHVLAGTLALGAWVCWLRACSDEPETLRERALPGALAGVLMLLAVLARVDCWPQLSLIGLWGLAHRPLGEPGAAALRGRWRTAAGSLLAFALIWSLIGAYAYRAVVLPSDHPPPSLADWRMTAGVLFEQLWIAATADPAWLSPLTAALAALGCAAALVERRFVLVGLALVSWALVFVPLGRNLTHDGLTGTRYFVLAWPVLLVLVAAGAQAVAARLVPDEARWRWPDALAGAALLALAGFAARPGLTHEYTFQAEYRALAEGLAALERERGEDRGLGDCTLYYVAPRQHTGEVDFDCCLDPERTPLALASPSLRFRRVPTRGELPRLEEEACALYYRGTLCAILTEHAPRTQRALAQIREQCARADAWMEGGEALVSTPVTRRSLNERWAEDPVIELRYWSQPPQSELGGH